MKGFSFAALTLLASQAIVAGSCAISYGLPGFEALGEPGYVHKVAQAPWGKAGTEIESFKWFDVMIGDLKTSLSDTHHAFKLVNYAHRYLVNIQYQSKRRCDLAAMVPRLATVVARTRRFPKPKIIGRHKVGT